jgi:hypothetical protein
MTNNAKTEMVATIGIDLGQEHFPNLRHERMWCGRSVAPDN